MLLVARRTKARLAREREHVVVSAGVAVNPSFAAGAAANDIECFTSGCDRTVGTISSVTYDGNAMTSNGTYNESDGNSQFTSWVSAPGAALLPDTGDVVATASGALGALGLARTSHSGVNEVTPIDAMICTDTENPTSDVVVPSAIGSMIVDYIWDVGALNPGPSQTQRANTNDVDGLVQTYFLAQLLGQPLLPRVGRRLK